MRSMLDEHKQTVDEVEFKVAHNVHMLERIDYVTSDHDEFRNEADGVLRLGSNVGFEQMMRNLNPNRVRKAWL